MRVLVTIPVFNEELLLANTIRKLHKFLESCGFQFEIVIGDNASTDQTPEIGRHLAREFSRVSLTRIELKGRGRALKMVWEDSTADILSYMDADLSTELDAFPKLVDSLARGGFDVATGSRLLDPRLTTRTFSREVMSRGYNLLVRGMLGTRFSDAQCGFKAITREAWLKLMPLIEDTGWFFDTELLAFAEKLGYRIFDRPVRWIDNQERKSRVKIVRTVASDVRGLLRLRRKLQRFSIVRASI